MMNTRGCKKRISVLVLVSLLMLTVLSGGCGSAGTAPGDVKVPGKEGSTGNADNAGNADSAGEAAAPEAVEEGLFRAGLVEDIGTLDVHRTTSEYLVPQFSRKMFLLSTISR